MAITSWAGVRGGTATGVTQASWAAVRGGVFDPGAQAETATVAMALSGISFSASVIKLRSGSAALHLTKPSFSVTAARKETATVSLATVRFSFAATAMVARSVHATMSLNGITIVAFASDLSGITKLRQFSTFG